MSVRATRSRPEIATGDGGRLTATVAAEHHIMGQRLLKGFEVPILDGREKARRELLVVLARGREPRAPFLDVPAGARDELPGVGLARGDDLRDPPVGLVKHLAQQERGALLGRQTLEQDEEGERQ
jgi:hypothetical protein